MGFPKALLEHRGRTFLETIVTNMRTAGLTEIVVVLGHDPDRIRSGARLDDAAVVENPHHPEGQFSSLQRGVAEALDISPRLPGGTCRGVVVALVDQPHVPAGVISDLLKEFERSAASVVRPVWNGRGGHPLLLSSETFEAILSLPRTATTWDVVRGFLDRRRDVPSPDDSVVTDIDTPEDFSRLTRNG
jgi:CTP:molybdopterin cytidylyltransferase MocA